MKTAIELRIEWMRLMGVPEDEIQECLVTDSPTDIAEEQKELDAAIHMRDNPVDLSWLGPRIEEIKMENGVDKDARCAVCLSCRKIIQSDEYGNWYCDCHDERP